MTVDIQQLSTPQNISWIVGVFLICVITLIQELPIKYKPWSWLLNQLGKSMNREVLEEVNNIKNTVEEMKERIKENEKENEKEKALSARRRILRFADECRRYVNHSEEYFNNILEDISYYKAYCDTHPNFENEKAAVAIDMIKVVYKRAYEMNDFL